MIQVEGLEKSYGTLLALRGVSFEIAQGEVVGFLGPNGAGKSTTMKILTGGLVPDAGRAIVAGREVVPGDRASRAGVGYLPESTPLYRGMRVDRYLEFVAGLHGLGRRALTEAVGRVVERCHLGSHVGRRIGQLSKGYRQRVGVAQALVTDPEVLILDEPTSGLDPQEVVRMRELLRSLGSDRTVMLSTHVLSEVEAVCGRVIVIAGGRLLADGTPADIARSDETRVSLVLRDASADRMAKKYLEDLARLPGVAALDSSHHLGGGAARVVYRVRRSGTGPGGSEPVAERLVEAAAKAGLRVSELRWEEDDLEAAFLSLVAQGGRTARPFASPAPEAPRPADRDTPGGHDPEPGAEAPDQEAKS